MPVYDFHCSTCNADVELFIPIKDFHKDQKCDCGAPLERLISANIGMVLKGDGWPGKAMRVKGQMSQKNHRLSQKSREKAQDAPPLKLVPNVGGEEVESWSEAQSLAASKGKNTSTYEPAIQKEKG